MFSSKRGKKKGVKIAFSVFELVFWVVSLFVVIKGCTHKSERKCMNDIAYECSGWKELSCEPLTIVVDGNRRPLLCKEDVLLEYKMRAGR